MIEFILNLVVSSLWIWGFHCVFKPRFIGFNALFVLFGISWYRSYRGYFMKPIASCPACMASVHGILMAIWLQMSIQQLPVFLIALCGLNFIIIEVLYGEK